MLKYKFYFSSRIRFSPQKVLLWPLRVSESLILMSVSVGVYNSFESQKDEKKGRMSTIRIPSQMIREDKRSGIPSFEQWL